MAEEKPAPEESGTAEQENTPDDLWAETESPYDAESVFTKTGGEEQEPQKEEPPDPVESEQSEPVQEAVQEETTAEEPVHDYEKRYKDLEKEFHHRNQERKQEREEYDRLRLSRLEEEQQREKERKELDELRQFREANSKPKDPTPVDDNYLSDDDKQTMEDFSEITGVVQKMIDQKIAKTTQGESLQDREARERLVTLEQFYQQEQVNKFLNYHDGVMKQQVGDGYLEIDQSPEFKSYVEASPTKLRIMKESTDPKEHAEVMNMFLQTSDGGRFRQAETPEKDPADAGTSQAELKRQAASGMMGNTAPIREPNPNNMSEDELWETISA